MLGRSGSPTELARSPGVAMRCYDAAATIVQHCDRVGAVRPKWKSDSPRVEDRHPGIVEVGDVARNQNEVVDERGRGDERVGAASCATC